MSGRCQLIAIESVLPRIALESISTNNILSFTTTRQDVRYVLLAIGLFISVVFLSATLATAFLLPSSHHVLHWRCQTFYVACLLVGDLLLAITQMSRNGLPQPFCSIIGKRVNHMCLCTRGLFVLLSECHRARGRRNSNAILCVHILLTHNPFSLPPSHSAQRTACTSSSWPPSSG